MPTAQGIGALASGRAQLLWATQLVAQSALAQYISFLSLSTFPPLATEDLLIFFILSVRTRKNSEDVVRAVEEYACAFTLVGFSVFI